LTESGKAFVIEWEVRRKVEHEEKRKMEANEYVNVIKSYEYVVKKRTVKFGKMEASSNNSTKVLYSYADMQELTTKEKTYTKMTVYMDNGVFKFMVLDSESGIS